MPDKDSLTELQKKRALYEKQVETLRLFLQRHAITQAQYDKSFRDLTEKMGFAASVNEEASPPS